jgi:hypothetical protein
MTSGMSDMTDTSDTSDTNAMQRAAEAVAAWSADQDELDVVDEGEGRWFVMLSGEHKRTIPVLLQLGEHTLDVQSFFMRAPDENERDLYAFLLRRNLRTYLMRFALHPDGDILLVGLLPCDSVTPATLDLLLGQLLIAADEAFDQALRLGFRSYIEREQQWRERVGLGRNPIT